MGRKRRQWHQFKQLPGDFIVEQNCHGLGILNWFAGSHPLKAFGDEGRKARKPGDNSDHANVIYTYSDGLKGWLIGTQLPASNYWDLKEQLLGAKGTVETERSYYRACPMKA
ncbi:MAG: hypothetical protein ACK5AZ_26725 [Bryobacteraceae bacterium]